MKPPDWNDILDEEARTHIALALWTRPEEMSLDKLEPDVREKVLSEKNSFDAWGARFRTRLERLMDDPQPLLPEYRRRYELFRSWSDSLSPRRLGLLTGKLGQDASIGFTPIPRVADVDIQIPRDNGADLTFQVGWHFIVGNFRGRDSKGNVENYGIEWVLFNRSILTPALAAELGLSNLENQLAEREFVVSKGNGPHLNARPLAVLGTTGLLEWGNFPMVARCGKETLKSEKADDMFPLRLQAKDVENDVEVDFYFPKCKTYVLQGENGAAPSISGVGSLYYSVPGISIDPSKSRMVFQGEEITVEPGGVFWLDHQWTTGLMPIGAPKSKILRATSALQGFVSRQPPPPVGWDWFAFQFDDDHQLTVSCAHSDLSYVDNTSPEKPPDMTSEFAIGKLVMPDSSVRDVKGEMTVTDWHKSPINGAWYPNGYEFSVDDGPPGISTFVCTPINDTGQLVTSSEGSQYREGPVEVTDTSSGAHLGWGYCEGVGYSNDPAGLLERAGLPSDADTVEVVENAAPDIRLAAKSAAFLAGVFVVPVITAAWIARRAIARLGSAIR